MAPLKATMAKNHMDKANNQNNQRPHPDVAGLQAQAPNAPT